MEVKNEKIIMLIDDNEIDNYIHKKSLEDRGIVQHILVMGTADKALKYLTENKEQLEHIPDVILLDINLPAVSGFGFIKKFRTLPQAVLDKCTVLILSSSDKEEDITNMQLDPLIKRYFNKPLSDEAMKQIKEMLN